MVINEKVRNAEFLHEALLKPLQVLKNTHFWEQKAIFIQKCPCEFDIGKM